MAHELKSRSEDVDLRVRQLLLELEEQCKKHITEINQIHDFYRSSLNQFRDLEEKCS
jgi:hypothetical protein